MAETDRLPDTDRSPSQATGEGQVPANAAGGIPTAWLALGVAVGVLLTALVFFYSGRTGARPIVISPPAPLASPPPSATPGPVRVYISGAIGQPAVYELPPNSIVQDLVEAAGGFTEQADGRLVNLAQPLADGLHVYVPAEGEEALAPGDVVRGPAPIELSGGQVNLNTAGQSELEQLPGIGPALAQRIIDYRQANGAFGRVEDVVNVSGIGPATLEKILDRVTVGQ